MFSLTPYRSNRIAPRGTLTLLDTLPWVDQLFQDNWDSFRSDLDFDEKAQGWKTELNLAGYKKEEIKIEVKDGQVIVTAENDKRGRAMRSYYVSEADPDKIEAKLEEGVLSLVLPRKIEKVPKRIAIS